MSFEDSPPIDAAADAKITLLALPVDDRQISGLLKAYANLIGNGQLKDEPADDDNRKTTIEALKKYEEILHVTKMAEWDAEGFVKLIEFLGIEDTASFYVIRRLIDGDHMFHDLISNVWVIMIE
jgi:hypothetical protein